MASIDHDLNREDYDMLAKFISYLGERTTWRCTFRESNRLASITFWDKNSQSVAGVRIGSVVDLLKEPMENLVTKKFYSKGWETQAYLYRISEEG